MDKTQPLPSSVGKTSENRFSYSRERYGTSSPEHPGIRRAIRRSPTREVYRSA